MRVTNLIIGDVKFQFKYGFYFVYTVLTLVYVCLLNIIPDDWVGKVAVIMIFSDPAAIGLFFMGAIVLLEKSQMVLNSIAVSPVKVSEYIMSKVISLGIISAAVGLTISIAAGIEHLFTVAVGVFLGSIIFTLVGLLIASNISSLNQFIVATVPMEIFFLVPPIFYIFGYDNLFMLIHPGCIIIRLISGNIKFMIPLIIILSLWTGLIYIVTYFNIRKMFKRVGGIKL